MRIIGEISHPQMKITVFKMDTRISVQFEHERYAQIFKYHDHPQIESFEDVKRLITTDMIREVLLTFRSMHQTSLQALNAMHEDKQDEFDEIL